MNIPVPDLNKILQLVEGAVRDVIKTLPTEEPDQHGGYFCLSRTPYDWPPALIVAIGDHFDRISGPERDQYFAFVQEKMFRFAEKPEHWPVNHVSSWVTRDPAQNRWGGGIRTGEYNMAFSGLPELADEAAMLLAAVRLGWLKKDRADDIAKISNNQIFLDNEWRVAIRFVIFEAADASLWADVPQFGIRGWTWCVGGGQTQEDLDRAAEVLRKKIVEHSSAILTEAARLDPEMITLAREVVEFGFTLAEDRSIVTIMG